MAHRQSLPILRPLYLQYPELEEAYRHPHEYFFGEEMLVAPVLDASGQRTVYLPPGRWIDFFTGERHEGGGSFSAHYAVDRIPVFVRDGSIVPEQPADLAWSDQRPLDTLILDVYGSGKGSFELYEDDGVSLAYRDGRHAMTPMTYATTGDGVHHLAVGPTTGTFAGQVQRRSYELHVHGVDRPSSVSVNGRRFDRWSWDAGDATAVITLPAQGIRDSLRVDIGAGSSAQVADGKRMRR